ncbi:Longitudinals lacking protein-like 12 [Homarus americanus]|uniref:Longitudinals lacking protein-like 12 n=1 Tax=Homarus americanus TaxID=6706 RepID=A0A8J5NC18_HOMAM|nr:Longitudinals lacking protein-like 12 [Homarus americanus]
MDTGLLSLKWNNHGTTFFHVLSTIRRKESYCDVTLACEGKFYPVHKLVLSTCSEYFEEIFNRTQCKHPVIVLKDVKHEELEALLNYMYLGEVNVLQADLAGLIKAAECLKIKGLAVPDEAPTSRSANKEKRSAIIRDGSPPQSKRARQEDGSSLHNQSFEDTRTAREPSSRETRESTRTNVTRPSSQASEEGFSNTVFSQSGPSQESTREKKDTRDRPSDAERERGDRQKDMPPTLSPSQTIEVLVHDETIVKTEVLEEPKEEEENSDMMNSDSSIVYNPLTPGLQGDGVSEGPQGFEPQVLTSQPQTMEELVAQAMPGTSAAYKELPVAPASEDEILSPDSMENDTWQARLDVETMAPTVDHSQNRISRRSKQSLYQKRVNQRRKVKGIKKKR